MKAHKSDMLAAWAKENKVSGWERYTKHMIRKKKKNVGSKVYVMPNEGMKPSRDRNIIFVYFRIDI